MTADEKALAEQMTRLADALEKVAEMLEKIGPHVVNRLDHPLGNPLDRIFGKVK